MANTDTRKRALKAGLLRGLISLVLLVGGWWYPGTRVSHELAPGVDPDLRMGPVVLICFVAGILYGVLALGGFWRACGSANQTPSHEI